MKKYREELKLFIAEGEKLVTDLAGSQFVLEGIYASGSWLDEYAEWIRSKKIPAHETLTHEMERISLLSTPSPVLAVIRIPDSSTGVSELRSLAHLSSVAGSDSKDILILALDDIRDPGNLGTIIRIADWFGINMVLCSEQTVDLYNPKVVQATMGSVARVRVLYGNITEMIGEFSNAVPVYGTYLDGENLFETELPSSAILLIGNESRGISPELGPLVSGKLHIPSYGGTVTGKAESLNASVATAIICAEFRRKTRTKSGT